MIQSKSMGEGKRQIFHEFKSYVVKEEEHEDQSWESSLSSPSNSNGSSFDTTDDASSLNDFSELMAQLPIKRGLSKYYQGKSESFTSLARVTSIEDLAKKENPFNMRRRKMMKAFSKSHGGGLDTYKSHTLPKPIISKNRNSFSSSSSSSSLLSRRPYMRGGLDTCDVI